MKTLSASAFAVVAALLVASCSDDSASPPPPPPALRIVAANGAPLPAAAAGDAIALKVVVATSDGATHDLAPGAVVTWTSPGTVTALSPDTPESSPMPVTGTPPTAAFLANPLRADRNANLANVLFVLDAGTAQDAALRVAAHVTGGTPSGDVTAAIAVVPAPAGDFRRGAVLYGAAGANCARCHGDTGHGTVDADADGKFLIDGTPYDFPAPGLDAEPGNVAADPDWNVALLAVAARADVDNEGVVLRGPMGDWLATPNPATNATLTTQDFADIFAWLKTQTR